MTYITTPIYYVNDQPHIGHAYTTVVADTVYRFKRLCGEDAFFQTGTDEHGEKIVEAAEKAGLQPQEFVDRISSTFRRTWPLLDIEPGNFIRTTDPHHKKIVQDILQAVHDRGDIYLGSYTGLYCKGCEQFLTEKELDNGNCPDHQTPPARISESNYFFRMSRYQEWLIDHIKSHPEFISPERYRNEVLAFLEEPLEDLCISRPTSRLTWGIPLPFDDGYVTYVWFDALINYITGIGYPDRPEFDRYWPVSEHIIAKDILKTHAVYWPTMLKGMGLEPYKKLHVHGWWMNEGRKMSKTLGNVIRPADLVADYGADAVRYFFLREMSFGIDASFSSAAMLGRQNADLANDLGNLFSRALTMIHKFAGGRIPTPGAPDAADLELIQAVTAMLAAYREQMNDFSFNRALQEVWQVISLANRYIVVNAPWELAKDRDSAARLRTVLYNLAEVLRLLALVLEPIMPAARAKMAAALGLEEQPALAGQGIWGLTRPGTAVSAVQALFPRQEAKQQPNPATTAQEVKQTMPEQQAEDPTITFEEFKKLELRVAEIVAAERIAKSDRLLKLTVRAPEERTLVAGIAEFYNPEDIIGKQVIMVANLKPAKLMGVMSHGMVLAARDQEGRLVLSGLDQIAAVGSRVS